MVSWLIAWSNMDDYYMMKSGLRVAFDEEVFGRVVWFVYGGCLLGSTTTGLISTHAMEIYISFSMTFYSFSQKLSTEFFHKLSSDDYSDTSISSLTTQAPPPPPQQPPTPPF